MLHHGNDLRAQLFEGRARTDTQLHLAGAKLVGPRRTLVFVGPALTVHGTKEGKCLWHRPTISAQVELEFHADVVLPLLDEAELQKNGEKCPENLHPNECHFCSLVHGFLLLEMTTSYVRS